MVNIFGINFLLLIFAFDCALCGANNTTADIPWARTSTPNTCTIYECSDYLKGIIDFIYKNNYDNYDEVLRYSKTSDDLNFQADVILTLYNAMDNMNHIYDPFRALRLYNTIETFLNTTTDECLLAEKRMLLEAKNNYLLWLPIKERGADILTSAILANTCNQNNTLFQRWCDELYASNKIVWKTVISTMVNRIRFTLSNSELISRLSNYSIYLLQNVEAMLVLHEEFDQRLLRGVDQMDYLAKLLELKNHRDYLLLADIETQLRVDNRFPVTVNKLLNGKICLNQRLLNGSIIYIHTCDWTERQCSNVYTIAHRRAVFNGIMTGNLTSFKFRSAWYNNRPMTYNENEVEEPSGFTFNVFSPSSNYGYLLDWKIQLDGEQLVVQTLDRTMTLCAGNILATKQGSYAEWYAYTRRSSLYDNFKGECRWNVEDCSFVQ